MDIKLNIINKKIEIELEYLEKDGFLEILKKNIEDIIEKIAIELNYESAYYDFKIDVIEKSESFYNQRYMTILDFNYNACDFCGKPTMYFERESNICPECYAKLNKTKKFI